MGRSLVDLHCHILPDLDDGARDLADSVAMAAQAQRDGIELVCATPHIRDDHRVEIEEIPERVAALELELERQALNVRVVTGGEVAQPLAEVMDPGLLSKLSLAGGGWVLVEPAPGPLGGALEALVGRLRDEGLGTVIAHPERHAAEDFEERLCELSARGALIQWTADFIAQAEPGGFVMRLAREGLVHVLGSDSHSSLAGRPAQLSGALERLAEVCSPDRLGRIAEKTPWAIVRGEQAIGAPEP